MLAIRLQRIGKKHQPSYRLVVAERRSKLIAPPVEDLGSYNPFSKALGVKKERVEYWLTKGAKPTVTAWNLLISNQVVPGKKLAVKMNKPEQTAEPQAAKEKASEPEAPEASDAAEEPASESVSA